jgi:hypothetical protein
MSSSNPDHHQIVNIWIWGSSCQQRTFWNQQDVKFWSGKHKGETKQQLYKHWQLMLVIEPGVWRKPAEAMLYRNPVGRHVKKRRIIRIEFEELWSVHWLGDLKGSRIFSYFSAWVRHALGPAPYGTRVLRKQINYMISRGNQNPHPPLHFKICRISAEKICIMKENRIWLHRLYKWCLAKATLSEYQCYGPWAFFFLMFSLLCISRSCFLFHRKVRASESA